MNVVGGVAAPALYGTGVRRPLQPTSDVLAYTCMWLVAGQWCGDE